MDTLMDAYQKLKMVVKNGSFMLDNKLNISFLLEFLTILNQNEEEYFTKTLPIFLERMSNRTWDEEKQSQSKKDWEFENIIKEPYLPTINERGKLMYYEKSNFKIIFENEFINNICKSYLDTINWIIEYYFCDVNDKQFYFKYNCAPFIPHLIKYIKNKSYVNPIFIDNNYIENKKQLFIVIHPTYWPLLKINENNEFDDYVYLCPSTFKINKIHQCQMHKCDPILPTFNLDLFINQ